MGGEGLGRNLALDSYFGTAAAGNRRRRFLTRWLPKGRNASVGEGPVHSPAHIVGKHGQNKPAVCLLSLGNADVPNEAEIT